MTKTTDKSTSAEADLVAQANEEMLALQRQLTELTEQNTALKQANDSLSGELEESAEAVKSLAGEANGLRDQVKSLEASTETLAQTLAPVSINGVPTSADNMPDEVHAQLASDPSIVAAAGLTNGEAPHAVRQKLLDAAHRVGAFLEGGIFHNAK